MCTTVGNGGIIILSDDDDEDCGEPSVLVVELEDVKDNGNVSIISGSRSVRL